MTIPVFDVTLTTNLVLVLLVIGVGLLIILSLSVATVLQNARRASTASAEPTETAKTNLDAALPLEDWNANDDPIALGLVHTASVTKRPPSLIVGLLLVMMGVGLLGWGGLRIYRGLSTVEDARNSEDWPSVLGQITLVQADTSDNRYQPVINYVYEVDGKTYSGDRFSFRRQEPFFLTLNGYNNYLLQNGYVQGRGIRVYYEPNNPKNAVLVREHDISLNYVILGAVGVFAGAIVLGFGIAHTIEAWRHFRQPSMSMGEVPSLT